MATLVSASPEVIQDLRQKLIAADTPLAAKYRALYSLRGVEGLEAHLGLVDALKDESALFRHDVAFCLGQRQDAAAICELTRVLHDVTEHCMVRHEAGEALGAIGSEACMEPLRLHQTDDMLEVAETCQLALQRIEYLVAHPDASNEESPYYSVDPTPALPASTPLAELRTAVLDENKRMFDVSGERLIMVTISPDQSVRWQRYSALFALRNKGGKEAVAILGEVFGARSALLKHETAYVLGQMQDAEAVAVLMRVLKDADEHAMVRHEAAEALGAIADSKTIVFLKGFSSDPEPIVADSCVVALDMLEFERSGMFQYADMATGSAQMVEVA